MRIAGLAVLLLFAAGCGKADIDVQCTMNGLGQGSCSFTNTGSGGGALCGQIKVYRTLGDDHITSNKFCSGEVGKSSTANIDFSIPDVRTFCDGEAGQSWSDLCAFEFVDSDG